MKIIRNPTNIYLFKVSNRNTRKKCKIYSKLTIKTSERRKWRRSGVFTVNFEHIISQLFLVLLLLTLNKSMLAGKIFTTNNVTLKVTIIIYKSPKNVIPNIVKIRRSRYHPANKSKLYSLRENLFAWFA